MSKVWPSFVSRSEFFALTLITHLPEKAHIISCLQHEFYRSKKSKKCNKISKRENMISKHRQELPEEGDWYIVANKHQSRTLIPRNVDLTCQHVQLAGWLARLYSAQLP